MRLRVLAITMLVGVFAPATTWAACTNPGGTAGDQIYNGTVSMMQYCNGIVWVNMGSNVNSTIGTLTPNDYCLADPTGVFVQCTTPSTGTGSVVLSASPTLTGTVSGASSNWTGTIGIATTTPESELEVYSGEVQIGSSGAGCTGTNAGALRYASGTLYFCNGSAWTASSAGGASAAGSNTQIQYNNSGALGASSTFVYSGGYVGIGTSAPIGLLHLRAGTNQDLVFTVPLAQSLGGRIANINDAENAYELMEIDASPLIINMSSGGNVGIGTTAPGALLTVGSNAFEVNSSGNTTVKQLWVGSSGVILLQGAGGTLEIADSQTVITGGNVGIGTASPIANLHVYGTASVNGLQMEFQNPGATAGHYRVVGANSGNNFAIYNQSALGVYLTDGGTSWTAGSDMRLKKNVKTLTVLDRLKDYRAVSFDWKSNDRPDVGVIAQELYKVFPEVVIKGSDSGTVTKMSDPGVWGVQYDKLGVFALEGVKELKSLFDGDHDAIVTLKSDNDNLRAMIEQNKREIKELKRERRAQ